MFESLRACNFGDEMRNVRKNNNFTQSEVSALLGISTDTLRRIEKGEVIPKIETLLYLGGLYGENLLMLFDKCTRFAVFEELFSEIDLLIHNEKTTQLVQRLAIANKMIAQHDNVLCNSFECEQFKNYIQALTLFYQPMQNSGQQDSNYNQAIKLLSDALHLRIADFQLSNVPDNLTQLELRLIMMLITILYQAKKYNACRLICDSLINTYDFDQLESIYQISSLSKIIALTANVHHNLQNYQQALDYADLGIELCLRRHVYYELANHYFRRACALYHLNHGGYQNAYQKCLNLLAIEDDNPTLDQTKQVAQLHYNNFD